MRQPCSLVRTPPATRRTSPFATASVFLAITVTCIATWLLMRYAARAERLIPKTILRAFERVMGLLLAAVAVEFVAGGVRDLIAHT